MDWKLIVEIFVVELRTSEFSIVYLVHVVGMSLMVFLVPELPYPNVRVALAGVLESLLR